MSVGQNIKKYRKKAGLTQEKLGIAIGKKAITIRKYESDDISPNMDILNSIAKAVDTNVYNLIDNNTTLTSKLITLFEKTTCKNCDGENTLEVISELIDIDEEVINKAMEDEDDISESYLVCMLDQIFKDSPGAFEKFYKENKYFISSEYDIVDKKCSELELEYTQYISFLSRLSVINPLDKCISNVYQKALNNTLTREDIQTIEKYKHLESNLIHESPKEAKKKVEEVKKSQINITNKYHNKSIQDDLLYNIILSILKGKYYEKIDNIIKNLKLDNVEQLAVVILETSREYSLNPITISINKLISNPYDLSYRKDYYDSIIQNFNDMLPGLIEVMQIKPEPLDQTSK